MTTLSEEKYDAGTSPDDFIAAEDPPDPDAGDVSAGHDDGEAAPYGWTRDKKTGELRPKVRPGRPKVPPGVEEIAASEPIQPDEDKPPRRPRQPKAVDAEVPMPRGGVIAKGVNRLYKRAGKIVRAMDYDIGTAIIECATTDEDITVGEAWENLCRTNPRIRAVVLKMIEGGAWGELIMAHAPIALAIMMKPAVLKRIPFRRLVESMAERDEDSPQGDLAGLTPDDVQQMGDMSEVVNGMVAARFGDVPQEVIDQAQAMAASMMGGEGPPPQFAGVVRRQQPKSTSRAQRTGKR